MKDKFTLEDIEAALCKVLSSPYVTPSASQAMEISGKIKAELTRSEPEFCEGEVVAYGPENDQRYDVIPLVSRLNTHARPLTLTEHGKHVRDLRDAVAKAITILNRTFLSNMTEAEAQAIDVLFQAKESFDAAVKDE